MGTINRTNISDHLIRHQLEMIGKTFEEAQKDDMWFFNWTMTQEQADQFRGYAIPLIKKVFKCNRQKAEATFSWFFLEFGLRVKD
jgi:beta-xylosidase